MTQQNLQELTRLVRETMELSTNAGPFRPTIFYDSGLDTITVITRDCSVLEETPNNNGIAFLEDNLRDRDLVGLFLYGAKRFCQTHGMMNQRKISVDTLLDALANFSNPTEQQMIEKLRTQFIEGASFTLFE